MSIVNSQFTTISAGDIAPWPNLAVLIVNDNAIAQLDGDLFQQSPRLAFIDFQGNLIENVGANLLSNLNELTFVSFINNPCINEFATTPYQIESLRVQLLTQCPPLDEPTEEPETTVETCTARCSIDDEVDDLTALAEEQALRIENLEEVVRELTANQILVQGLLDSMANK